MKRVALGLVAGMVVTGCAHREPPPESTKESPIERLQTAAQVGSDDAYTKLLAGARQREDLTAPMALRKVLSAIPPERFSLEQGYSHEGGRAGLFWWVRDMAYHGDGAALRAQIFEALKAEGYRQDHVGDKSASYYLTDDKVAQRVVLRGPNASGSAGAGNFAFEINWTVQDRDSSNPIPLSEVLKQMPVLQDPRVEPKVYETIGPAVPAYLSVGGRWKQYYRWTGVFAESGRALHDTAVKLLLDLGYQLLSSQSGMETYQRPSTRSYAWITPSPERVLTEIRIQPDS